MANYHSQFCGGMDPLRAFWFTLLFLMEYEIQASKREFAPPRIYPVETEYILCPNEDFTLRCEGKAPITWNLPDNLQNGDKEPTHSTITIRPSATPNSEYSYGSILTILNASYLNTGFYHCLQETADLGDLSRVSNVYIYVDDPAQLSILPQYPGEITVFQYSEVVLPCRPTSPNVNVTLADATKEGEVVLDKPDPEGNVVTFDRRKGFTISQISNVGWLTYHCDFVKDNLQFNADLSLQVLPLNDSIATPFLETVSGNHTVVGKTLMLKCTVRYNTSKLWEIKWIVPDQSGITGGRILVSKTTKLSNNTFYQELTINQTIIEDQGTYVCVVKNDGNIHNDTKFVRIYDKPDHFINLTEEHRVYDISVQVGDASKQRRINVKADSFPLPKLAWYNPKGEFISAGWSDNNNQVKYEIHTNGSTETSLVINNITIQDWGVYQVKATTELEKKVANFSLNVEDKPTVEIQTSNFHMVNKTSTIKCLVTAYPEPNIYWFYKDCLDDSCDFLPAISQHSSLQITEGISSNSYLTITANQSGHVKCTANNSLGVDESIVEFLVTDVINGFGIFYLNEDNVEEKNCTSNFIIAAGETITLYCAASRHQYTNQLKWFKKSGHDLIELEDNDRYAIDNNSTNLSNKITFLIHNASSEDSGSYTCQAEKLNMTSTERFALDNIAVTVRDLKLPKITKTNLNGTEYPINYPDRVELWCYAKGFPKPTITWYKDGKEVVETTTNGATSLEENNSKLIFKRTEPQDEGSYVCSASNKVGTVEKQMKLLVKNKPEIIYHDNTITDKNGINYKYVLLIILAMAVVFVPLSLYQFVRFRKERKLGRELKRTGLANFEIGSLDCLNPELGVNDQAELLPYDKKFEFPIENLKLGKKLGSGAFGVVMKAEAVGIIKGETSTSVAVKMVKRSIDYTFIKALASELKIMVHLGKHLNVVNLLGACTKNIVKGELLVISEYCRYGNLHNFLLRHRNSFTNQIDAKTGNIDYAIGAEIPDRTFSVSSNDGLLRQNHYHGDYKENFESISTKDLIIWAFQVARGMEYLASRKVLHGDLAARNILLADYNVVKICDFGLAKRLYSNDIYKNNKDGLLPVKWMAVESIRDRIFSTQSDIWSFGIVLWEFFSLACTPYPGVVADEKFCDKLVDGYRMDSPEFATNEIYKMMYECWHPNPLNRPSFTNLVEIIGYMLERSVKQHYVHLNDPYVVVNTQRLENGDSDYLAMLSSPDFEHRSTTSPHHYVNANVLPNTSPNFTATPSYLCMRPSHIFSPVLDLDNVFTFDAENSDGEHKTSNGEKQMGTKLLPPLHPHNKVDIIPKGMDAFSNPTYHMGK